LKRVGIVIQARMGSTRLPGKVLESVEGEPLLGHLIRRMKKTKRAHGVVVATTNLEEDSRILDLSASLGVPCVAGAEDDLLSRYLLAANSHDLDVVVRVTADCPLLDPGVVDSMIDEFLAEGFDFLSNSEPLPATWPDGMDVSIFTREALILAVTEARLPSEREHVTFFFWKSELFKTKRVDLENDLSEYRLTVDYPEDLDFLRSLSGIAEKELRLGLFELDMETLISILDDYPNLRSINGHYSRGLGWKKSFEADVNFGKPDNLTFLF